MKTIVTVLSLLIVLAGAALSCAGSAWNGVPFIVTLEKTIWLVSSLVTKFVVRLPLARPRPANPVKRNSSSKSPGVERVELKVPV